MSLGELSPQEAADMMRVDIRAVLVDVRSSMEYLFVGHPAGAIHLPWIDEPDWTVNPNFVTDIRKLMLGGTVEHNAQQSAPIILICRSGKRSKEAGDMLLQSGLTNIYHVGEGFEGDLDESHQRGNLGGWRFHGLPWEQC